MKKSINFGQVDMHGLSSSNHGSNGHGNSNGSSSSGAGGIRQSVDFSNNNGNSSISSIAAIAALDNPIIQELARQARLETTTKLIKNEEGDTFLRVGKGTMIGDR